MIGNELQQLLMSKGLTKQQATSITAEVCVNALIPDDEKMCQIYAEAILANLA